MSNILIAYPNRIDSAALAGGSWTTAFPLANVADTRLGKAARSADATRTSTRMRIKLANACKLRAVALAAHNMSSTARWRVRASTAPLDLLFDDPRQKDSRVTFSGGDNGTVVDAKGRIVRVTRTNLLLRSQEFDNAAWTSNSVAITANAATAPDGTVTGDKLVPPAASAVHYVLQAGATAAIGVCSVYAKTFGYSWLRITINGVAASAWFDVTNGVLGTVEAGLRGEIEAAGGGWYRCSVAFTGVSTNVQFVIEPGGGPTAAAWTPDGTSGIYLWGAQLEENSAATDYIPTTAATVTATASGRISYGSRRENLLCPSEDLSSASWLKSGTAITADATTAPDGATTADLVTESAAPAMHYVTSQVGPAYADTYTFSLFVKAAGRRYIDLQMSNSIDATAYCYIDLQTGTVTQAPASSLAARWSNVTAATKWYGSWLRVWITATKDGTGSVYPQVMLSDAGTGPQNPAYAGDGVSGIYVWGAQLVRDAEPGYYLPTRNGHALQNFAPWRTNLLTSSEAMHTWLQSAPGTVAPNQGMAPDGKQTATLITDTSNNYIEQMVSCTSKLYSWSVWIKAADGATVGKSAALLLVRDAYAEVRVKDFVMTAEWQRVSMTEAFTIFNGEVRARIGPEVGGGNMLVWGGQLETYIEPTDYIPTGVSRYETAADECLGLLVEDSQTNFLTSSVCPGGAGFADTWNDNGTAGDWVSNAAYAPDGTKAATKATLGGTKYTNLVCSTGALLIYSQFVKAASTGTADYVLYADGPAIGAASAYVTFSFTDGTLFGPSAPVVSSGAEDWGNGWWRVWMRVNAVATDTASFHVVAHGDTYVWGQQVETHSAASPSTYIPITAGAQVTRSADDARITGANFSGFFNSEEGTIYTDITVTTEGLATGRAPWSFNAIYSDTTVQSTSIDFRWGATSNVDANDVFAVIQGEYRIAAAYTNGGTHGVSIDGRPIVQTSGNSARVVQESLALGFSLYDGALSALNGYIKRFTYWAERLSNTDLKAVALSGPDAIGANTGWLYAQQMTFGGDTPSDWGTQYAAIAMLADADLVAQYLTIEVDDTANAAGYLQLGRVFAGSGLQPAKNASFEGFSDGRDDLSSVLESPSGTRFDTARRRRRVARFALKWLTQAEADRIHEMQAEVGTTDEVLYVPDPADLAKSQRYGFIGYLRTLGALDYPYPLTRAIPFEIAEKL
jgi:hypothetical protein